MAQLLEELKNYLDITWEDDSTNTKLEGMVARSEKRLNQLTATDIDYDEDGLAKDLLFNRVRYDRSGCLDDFEKNYSSQIIELQNHYRVKKVIDADA